MKKFAVALASADNKTLALKLVYAQDDLEAVKKSFPAYQYAESSKWRLAVRIAEKDDLWFVAHYNMITNKLLLRITNEGDTWRDALINTFPEYAKSAGLNEGITEITEECAKNFFHKNKCISKPAIIYICKSGKLLANHTINLNIEEKQ